MDHIETAQLADRICRNIETVIVGKTNEIRLILAALLAGGHVLLEDVPGTGKTMLAKALAQSFSCVFRRVQFTPDLLPSELTGIQFYSPKTGEFSFRQGSLFSNIVLADEINRATPRTQSGLLESMEEHQITVDGESIPLPEPYFVIATQNPVETQGTFPLPEAQLDRFLIQLSLGYPDTEETVQVLRRFTVGEPLQEVAPVCAAAELIEMREAVRMVYVHDDIYRYIAALAEATRAHEAVALGVSTRGCLGLARLAQSFAVINGRDYVIPDDIKILLYPAFSHRLIIRGARMGTGARAVLDAVVNSVTAPVEAWGR